MTINSNDSVTQKSELCFECPECGGNGIVEHLVNYEAIFIHEDGDYETGETEFWEEDNVEYTCLNCFRVIVDDKGSPIREEDELVRFLKNEPEGALTHRSQASGPFPVNNGEETSTADEKDVYTDILPFICPQCGGHRLDAVNHTATILKIYEDGEMEYAKTYGGDFDHFRCHNCLKVVVDEEGEKIDDPEALAEYLLCHDADDEEEKDDDEDYLRVSKAVIH